MLLPTRPQMDKSRGSLSHVLSGVAARSRVAMRSGVAVRIVSMSLAVRSAFLRSALLLGGALLVRCQPDYPLAPTPCDDWCFATQRAGCDEDDPERCVSSCEDDELTLPRSRCEEQWRSLSECYLQAPTEDFLCVEEESRPRPICIAERVALAACGSPESGSCLASCLRQADECGRPRRACELECRFSTPGCSSPAIALYQCRLASPVDCARPGEPDPRPQEEIPCFAQALTLLDCADYPRSVEQPLR